MKNLTKYLSVAVIAIAALSVTACTATASVPTSANSHSKSAVSAPSAPKPAAGTSTNPVPLGTTINGTDSTGNKFSLTYSDVSFNADAAVTAANQLNDPAPAGQQYLSVELTLTNKDGTGQGTGQVDPGEAAFSVNFVDASHKQYTPEITVFLADPIVDAGTLYPGTSATGSLVYAVPVGTVSGSFVVNGVFEAAK